MCLEPFAGALRKLKSCLVVARVLGTVRGGTLELKSFLESTNEIEIVLGEHLRIEIVLLPLYSLIDISIFLVIRSGCFLRRNIK